METTLKTTDKPLKKKREGTTYGEKRREEKRAALREYITGRNYLDAIHRDLSNEDISAEELPVIKFKTETRLKLLSKVLPDLKAVEHTGQEGGDILHDLVVRFVQS